MWSAIVGNSRMFFHPPHAQSTQESGEGENTMDIAVTGLHTHVGFQNYLHQKKYIYRGKVEFPEMHHKETWEEIRYFRYSVCSIG